MALNKVSSGTAKPQVYKGKHYPTIKALAEELALNKSYLGLFIKKYPDDIDKAVEATKAKMDPRNDKRGVRVEYKGVFYKSYSDLARRLLHVRPDDFNEKRYQFINKGYDKSKALIKAIEYYENTNN